MTPFIWFSVRRVDDSWKCTVWQGKRGVFTCYAGTRDGAWAQAMAHLAECEKVAT